MEKECHFEVVDRKFLSFHRNWGISFQCILQKSIRWCTNPTLGMLYNQAIVKYKVANNLRVIFFYLLFHGSTIGHGDCEEWDSKKYFNWGSNLRAFKIKWALDAVILSFLSISHLGDLLKSGNNNLLAAKGILKYVVRKKFIRFWIKNLWNFFESYFCFNRSLTHGFQWDYIFVK